MTKAHSSFNITKPVFIILALVFLMLMSAVPLAEGFSGSISDCAASVTSDLSSSLPESGNAESDFKSGAGNSFVATITPDAVIDGDDSYINSEGNEIPNAGQSGTFTITFTEVGNHTLGSAQVEIPEEFTDVSISEAWSSDGIETNDQQEWEGKLAGSLIYLRAIDAASYLGQDDWVSVTFAATTPSATGAYGFETMAWTDNLGEDSSELDTQGDPVNKNNMALGYIDPVVIVGKPVGDAEDLNNVRNDRLEHYIQTADICLEDGKWSADEGWLPIGIDWLDRFNGSYHGNSFVISNLTTNRPETNFVGLFGRTDTDSLIKNVALENVTVTGEHWVGGLVGQNRGAVYISCVSGFVTGSSGVGGLVGNSSYEGTVIGSYASAIVTGSNMYYGGLVGQNYGTITASYADSSVSGDGSGGLVGQNNSDGVITGSYAEGPVAGDWLVGGLAGSNVGTIINSYAKGTVAGRTTVGGLAGVNSALIIDCFAEGSVEGEESSTGGLVGQNNHTISGSHATGSVRGDFNVGGLVGLHGSSEGDITGSNASGDVTGTSQVGGLVGALRHGIELTDCYATGFVTGTTRIGGLVGYNESIVENCYATGFVGGDTFTGGLVGLGSSASSVINSYYDIESTVQDDNDIGEPKTTTEMQDINTFVGWDITLIGAFNPETPSTWFIRDGQSYPMLWWQYGDDSGDDNDGDENDLDDFDWSEGLPEVPDDPGPSMGARGWGRNLVFRDTSGPQPVISTSLVTSGKDSDLERAVIAFNHFLGNFEQNKDSKSDIEFAAAVIELAVARTAIIVVEVRLSGDLDAFNAAVNAYQFASVQLDGYGSYLSDSQADFAGAILDACDGVINELDE